MREINRVRWLTLGLLFCRIGLSGGADALQDKAVADVADQWLPAVVKVASPDEGKKPTSPKPEDQPNTSYGSGVVIDASGAILTSEHVVKDLKKVRVTFQNGAVVESASILHDPDTDLALVRLDPTDASNLTVARFGDSDKLRIGDTVIAMGTPFGLQGSVTTGTISAKSRRLNLMSYEDFLQTDVPINPGSSGGPLFNLSGEIVGIVTALRSKTGTFSGVGFAVPAYLARAVAETLLRYGKVPRSYLGVRTAKAEPALLGRLGLRHGVKVVALADGETPARRAGLQVGDIVVSVGGHEVDEPHQLVVRVAHQLPYTRYPLVVYRGGKSLQLSVELHQLLAQTASDARVWLAPLAAWGEPIGESVATRYGYQRGQVPANGFLLTDLQKGGTAEASRLKIGDTVMEADRVKISTAADLKTALPDSKLKAGALLLVAHPDGRREYLLIRKP